MKKVLVPVDFSEESMNALRFAVDLTAKSGGEIGLLHIIAMPVLQDSPRMPVERYRGPLIDKMKTAAHFKFLQLIQEHNRENVRISTDVLVNNHIHQTIAKHAEKHNFDTVIMGTRGASGIREWIIGSNTEKLVRTCPVPVLAVKKYTPGLRVKNIVFPNMLDTEHQEDLVTKIKVLQNFFQAELHIVWINTPAVSKPDADVRQRLKEFARRYMLKDYTIHVFNFTDEETGILEFTRQINGDLIAMGTRGLKGIAHLLLGSVAEDLVNHVQYPVWTYCTKAAFQTHER